MRLLLLSWEFPPHVVGGLGKHVADLAPALAAQGVIAKVEYKTIVQYTLWPGAAMLICHGLL